MAEPASKIAIFTELRVALAEDNTVIAPSGFGHDYWANCLGAPTNIVLVARRASKPPVRGERVDGRLVEVCLLPAFASSRRAPIDLLRSLVLVHRLLSEPRTLAWLRLPGIVGTIGLLIALARRQVFGVNVVGDPLDVAFRANVGGRLGKLAGIVFAASLRVACAKAAVVVYVTETYLQRRYPPRKGALTRSISNVDSRQFRQSRKVLKPIEVHGKPHFVTIASMDQAYKRVDLFLHVLETLRRQGFSLTATVIGDGRLRPDYERLAADLGLSGAVDFAGSVSPGSVSDHLLASDIFVLCSDTEGLPRALIEAMCMGVPSVATRVGGVPELLPESALACPGSVDSIVAGVKRLLVSKPLRDELAVDLKICAENYHHEVLQERRREVLAHLYALLERSSTR